MSSSDLAVSAAGSQTFHPFPYLPPELRFQIWRDTLPETDSPAFTPYQGEGWFPYEHAVYETYVEWELRYDSLDKIRVKIPLADVNREARYVAIEWIRKQEIEVLFHRQRQCFYFLRKFVPMYDVVWVGRDEFELFSQECWGIHNTDRAPESVSQPINIGQFAVPESLLMDASSSKLICETICCFACDVVMYVIAGEHPGFASENSFSKKIQARWELDGACEGEAIVWDRNSQRFDVKSGPRILGEHSYQRVLEVSELMAQYFIFLEHDIDFEIRAARAIRP